MAAQLARRQPLDVMLKGITVRPLSPRGLMIAVGALLALVYASMISSTYTSHEKRDAAEHRLADAEALLALPPSSQQQAQSELAITKIALADAEARAPAEKASPPQDLAERLVRQAVLSGVDVRGIAAVAPATTKRAEVTYDIAATRLTVEASVARIEAFVAAVSASDPQLVAGLQTLTINDGGLARAELTFSFYSRQAKPSAPARAPTKAAKR